MFTKDQIQKILNWLDAEGTIESHQARDVIQELLDDKPYVPLTLLISIRAFNEAVDDLVEAHYTKNVRQSITDQLRRIIEKAERRGANNGYKKLDELVKLGGIQQKRLLDTQFELVSTLEEIRNKAEQSASSEALDIYRIADKALVGRTAGA